MLAVWAIYFSPDYHQEFEKKVQSYLNNLQECKKKLGLLQYFKAVS